MILKSLLTLRSTVGLLSTLILMFFAGSIYAQAPCGNDAGVMSQGFFPACTGAFVSAGIDSTVIATANSSLIFILHDSPSTMNIGNVIAYNTDGIFDNDGTLPTNQDLFISGYVGPLDAAGGPILDDACASVALPGTPVRFYKPIELQEISSTCDPVSGCLTVEFTISGGAPAFPGNVFFEYLIEGDYSGVIETPGDVVTFTKCDTDGYEVEVVNDGKSCNAKFDVAAPCAPCNNDAGDPQPIQYVCDGASVSGQATGGNVDDESTTVYYLHSGDISNPIDQNANGTFINGGSYPANTQLFITAAVGPNGADLNDPCTDVQDVGSPVVFLTPITVTSTYSCDEVTGTSTVSYTVGGGQPAYDGSSYTIGGDPGSTSVGVGTHTFTIAEGTGTYSITAADGAGCTGEDSQPYTCSGCKNDAGTPNPAVVVCSGDSANGANATPVVDPGSGLVYALHTGTPAGILSTNGTGTFANDGTFPTNQQLYISAAVGAIGANGLPDLDDPCSDIDLPGTPVIFLTAITGSSSTTCDEITGTTTVTYSFSGGLPAYDGSSYTISGSASGSATAGQSLTFTIPETPEGGGSYDLTATDGNACVGITQGAYVCTGCDNFPGTPNAAQYVCDGASVNGYVSDPVIDVGMITYALHDGSTSVGTVYDTSSNSQFTNNGVYPTNTQLYISSIVGPDGDGDGVPDLNDPCTVVQLPGSPVVFLTPIVVTFSSDCDDATGISTITYSSTGGLPAFDSSAYTYTGVDGSGSLTQSGSGSLNIGASDGAGCSGTVLVPYTCEPEVFDLALIKTISAGQTTPIYPGDDVTFTITVTNQGTVSASNFTITDYIPAGMSLNDADWTASGANATITMAGPLAPGGSTSVDITLTVNSTSAGDLVNYAEISSATGVTPGGTTITDIDSTPDNDNTNDAGGVPNSGTDNTINNEGGDEDDHDPALISVDIFDLAIAKDLAPGTPSTLLPGDNVTFVVTVTNEGTVAAQNIDLIDYVPAGLTLNDAAWTLQADGNATNSIPGPIAPGGSASVNITFSIDAGFSGQIRNVVEIAGAEDPNGNMPDDIDSTPGNGDNGEDDVDDAIINIAVFDLALMKVLAPGQAALFVPGDDVTFTITVYNQGTVDAFNVQVIDHIPAGLTLNDAGWTGAGSTATTTIAGPIAAGSSASVNITLTVTTSAPGDLTNFAEITSAQDPNGNTPTDVDSTGDTDPNNDTIVDDEINNGGGDEDDSDIAVIAVGCSNDAGDVPQAPVTLCAGESTTVTSTGSSLADGADLFYALHDAANAVGNIIAVNQTGTFVNDGTYTYGVQYYVSPVAAQVVNGGPDLTDPCLDVTLPGTPVIFYGPVVIAPGAVDCDMVTGDYTVSFTISGGAGSYTVSGDYSGTTTGGGFTFVDNGDGNISINVVDAAGCTASYSAPYTCMGCDNNPGILQPFNDPICYGSSYGFDAVGASAAQSGAVLYYVLTDGATSIGTIYEANTTGVFIHDGSASYPTNTPLYVYSVVGPPGAMGYPDLSDPCTVVSNPPAQVGFLDPVEINHDYTCDNSVGEIIITFDISGGGPAFPGSGHSYTVTGSYSGMVTPGQVITVGPITDGESYAINVVSDGKGCEASYVSDPLQCDKLPVELISFDGEVQQNGNYLKWTTGSEINNEYFTMERSTDGGRTFTKIGQAIEGAGTTPNPNSYDLLDREAPSGTSVYQLSQTDFDGTTVIVGVVELTRGEATLAIIDIYPIPVDHLMNIQISSNTDSELNVSITDMLGRTIYSQLEDVNMDLNELQISTNSLSPGVYFLTIEGSDNLVTQKFVKE